ncbi:hypothetical protein [Tepidibacillus decaturensis]|nr:hypothetical protein [Tepidibacillus decaturensis]
MTEEILLDDLEQIREEMWTERKHNVLKVFVGSNIIVSTNPLKLLNASE